MPSLEVFLESSAYPLVEQVYVVGAQSLAVRRVCDEHTFRGVFGPVGHRFAHEFHHVVYSSRLDIFASNRHGLRVDVAAINLIGELTFCGVVVVNVFKKLLVEIRPFLESETFAVDSRVDVSGNQCRLHKKCARTAHGVDEVAVTFPSCFKDDSGGKHFINRGFGLFSAISSLRQRLSAGVERDSDTVFGNVHIQ